MSYATNGNFDLLVEQITDAIVARLNGEAEEQAAYCGCASECFHRCPERISRIVDAGAARIGATLGEAATARDWASFVDHTLLKPEASETDIRRLCDEARQYGFASVCVNPAWVRAAARNLRGSNVLTCTVIGFPLGANLADVKAYEARRAIMDGAQEVDMVINIGALKSGDDCAVENDIRAVALPALRHRVIRAHMQERQARLAMNQKKLLHAIDQTAQHHHLGKTPPRAQRLETPLQSLPGKRVLERLIKRLQ